MIEPESHRLFARLCDAAQSFVLTTHLNPDGDAIGSEISLARFLVAGGKQVAIINHDPTPDTLKFVEDPSLPIQCYDPAIHDAALGEADLVVLVDNSAPDRLGRMEKRMVELAGNTLCIDHHPGRSAPWGHQIVDVSACATAMMVHELTRAQGWTPDLVAAEAIYVGLATDTGFFRFNSTSARAHQVAAELLELGVRPARAYREVYERNTLAYTHLLGHALSAVQLDGDGAVASVRITRELETRLGAQDVDTSEITTSLLALDTVQIVALFRELPDQRVKVSLRSKAEYDVHGLATEFGGGGHRNASGIVLDGALDAVATKILDRAVEIVGVSGD